MKLRLSKKTQMEILGLAMIMLFLSFGLLFVVRFVVMTKPVDVKKSYLHTEMAQNMLTAMMKTTTGCKGTSLQDLLEDCGKYREIDCDNDPSTEDSCRYANATIDMMLNNTLRKWNKIHEFNVSIGDDTLLFFEYGNSTNLDRERKINLIPLYPQPGSIFIKLDIYG